MHQRQVPGTAGALCIGITAWGQGGPGGPGGETTGSSEEFKSLKSSENIVFKPIKFQEGRDS